MSVPRGGLVEDLRRHGDLADVVEERGDPQPVDVRLRQVELATNVGHDRGDQGRGLAAVVGEG
jgi:hypothetical protein